MPEEERRISPGIVILGGLGLALVGMLGLASIAWAAPPVPGRANLYGVVTDAQTGYPISGVKVTIDGLTTYTNASGNYGFTGLAPRGYTITFEKDGYETAVY